MDDVSTGAGYTLSPWIIYPLARGVQSLDGLFIHSGGVYTLFVDYLSNRDGCTLTPWIIYPLGRVR